MIVKLLTDGVEGGLRFGDLLLGVAVGLVEFTRLLLPCLGGITKLGKLTLGILESLRGCIARVRLAEHFAAHGREARGRSFRLAAKL